MIIKMHNKVFKSKILEKRIIISDVDEESLNLFTRQAKYKDNGSFLIGEDVPYMTKDSYGFLTRAKCITTTFEIGTNKYINTVQLSYYKMRNFKYNEYGRDFSEQDKNLLFSNDSIKKFNL